MRVSPLLLTLSQIPAFMFTALFLYIEASLLFQVPIQEVTRGSSEPERPLPDSAQSVAYMDVKPKEDGDTGLLGKDSLLMVYGILPDRKINGQSLTKES